MRRRLFFLLFLTWATPAWAIPGVRLDKERLVLGDIVKNAPEVLAQVDLGEVPRVGASRVVTKEQVLRRLREAGIDHAAIEIPDAVRVQSAEMVMTPGELVKLARSLIESELKPGVELKRVEIRNPVKLSPSSTLEGVIMNPLPRRVGRHRTTVMIEVVRFGQVEQRVPAQLELYILPEGAEPLVRRGSRVTLVVNKNNATVSVEAVALGDGDHGEVISFRVERTSKALKGRIDSKTSASVVSS